MSGLEELFYENDKLLIGCLIYVRSLLEENKINEKQLCLLGEQALNKKRISNFVNIPHSIITMGGILIKCGLENIFFQNRLLLVGAMVKIYHSLQQENVKKAYKEVFINLTKETFDNAVLK